MLMELKVENLHKMDKGRLGAALQLAIRRAFADMRDRPAHDAARTVTLKIDMAPIPNDPEPGLPTELDQVDFLFEVKTTLPSQKGTSQRLVVDQRDERPAMLFNDQTADARQGTLDELAPPDGK